MLLAMLTFPGALKVGTQQLLNTLSPDSITCAVSGLVSVTEFSLCYGFIFHDSTWIPLQTHQDSSQAVCWTTEGLSLFCFVFSSLP
jgi:hypothetical protein